MSASQIILVTGATSGIGRETALLLAKLGHRVFATGRKETLLTELATEAEGLALETFPLDVTQADAIREAREIVNDRTEGYGLDVLVNNAGFGLMSPMELITAEDMRAQYEANVFGLMAVTQAFAGAMRERGAGKIVNIGSVVGRMALPLQGIYCSTKHAVDAITAALRMELASFGVHVSLVEPGTIKTHFGDTATSTVGKYEALPSPYKPAIRRYKEVLDSVYKKAVGPAGVARTVARIVRKRRPKARYVSPRYNSIVIWLTRLLPMRWGDAIMRRTMGLTPKALNPPRGAGANQS